jgi:hypothetical protein
MLSSQLKNLPTFNGNPDEDAIQWLKDITDRLNYVKFTDDQKLSIIAGCMDGNARRWLFGNLSILDSWSIFIQELKNEFASTLMTEDGVSQLNQFANVLDETTVYYDGDMKKEQKCELLEENETYFNDSDIILVELNKVVSPNMRIMESGENNFETIWPDGSDSWFIHVQLPQRRQFIRCEPQDVPFSLTQNIDDDFSQENLPNCIDDSLPSAVNDVSVLASCDIEIVDNPLKLYKIYDECGHSYTKIFSLPSPPIFLNDLLNSYNLQSAPMGITLLTFTFLSLVVANLSASLISYNGTVNSYVVNKMVLHGINNFEWFRTLAVP